jgi:hypothetical protein
MRRRLNQKGGFNYEDEMVGCSAADPGGVCTFAAARGVDAE